MNSCLVQASSLEEAYDKALKIGKENYTMRYKAASGKICSWKVLGIASLVPIYEDIQDGTEIGFTSMGSIAAKTGSALVKSKRDILSGN